MRLLDTPRVRHAVRLHQTLEIAHGQAGERLSTCTRSGRAASTREARGCPISDAADPRKGVPSREQGGGGTGWRERGGRGYGGRGGARRVAPGRGASKRTFGKASKASAERPREEPTDEKSIDSDRVP
jgi:hypothetical protein